jgi:gas vesicle protein
MFVRNVSIRLKPNTLSEFTRIFEKEVIPMLRKQSGFRDEIAFAVPGELDVVAISLWDTKEYAEAYKTAGYPEVLKILDKVLDGTPKVQVSDVISSTIHKPAAVAAWDGASSIARGYLRHPFFWSQDTFTRGCASEAAFGLRCRGLRLRALQVKGGLKMKTEWAFLAGLGVGAVAGLVAGLMVAPQSGKDTQELLAGKLRGGLDQVASTGKKVRAQVKDLANRGKENVAEAIDAGQEAYRASGTEG